MALSPSYPIETERLILRPFVAGDLRALSSIYADREVVRYLYTELWTPAVAHEQLGHKIAGRHLVAEGGSLNLAVVPRGSDRLIGEVLLFWRSEAHRQGEIGYVTHPDAQGRGFTTEALRALLHLGFDGLGLHRIFGRCDARNTASIRVMEHLGMRLEAHLRNDERIKGAWCDTLYFALLEQEWREAP